MSADQEPRKCTRFPCDLAYKRRLHTPDSEGDVFHYVHWAGDMDMDNDDLPFKWQVRSIAWNDDEPWHVELVVGESSFQFWKVKDAQRAIDGLISATLCAAEATVKEAER